MLIEWAEDLIDLNRWEEAIPILNEALAFEPDDVYVLCLLAQAHLMLGDEKLALDFIDRAGRSTPAGEWGQSLRGYMFAQHSLRLLHQGRTNAALLAAEEAARLGPDLPPALYALAYAQAATSNLDRARQTAELLLVTAPELSLSAEAMALVACEEGNWPDAEEQGRRAITLDPESVTATYILGCALAAQHRLREAILHLHRATELDPGFKPPHTRLRQTVNAHLGRGIGLLIIFAWAFPILSRLGIEILGISNATGASWSAAAYFGLILGDYSTRFSLYRRLPAGVRAALARRQDDEKDYGPSHMRRGALLLGAAAIWFIYWHIIILPLSRGGGPFEWPSFLILSSIALFATLLALALLRRRRRNAANRAENQAGN